MAEDIVAEIKKDYILQLAEDGKRHDGRAFEEFRKLHIQPRYIQQAEGSARVKLGDTDLIVGIKMSMGTPYPDAPNSGTMTMNAELRPVASADFEIGPPSPTSIEVARVIDRGIREAKAIDFDKLCITPGEKIWMTWIDMHVLDYDGNLFDAGSLGAMAALMTSTLPLSKLPEGGEDIPMPVQEVPVMITAMKLGKQIVYDPTTIEEKVGGPRLSTAYDRDGNIRAMQKGLGGAFTRDEISQIVRTGRDKAAELRAILEKSL